MKFSISNLAWQKKEEKDVLNLVKKKNQIIRICSIINSEKFKIKKRNFRNKKLLEKKRHFTLFHAINFI